MALTPPELSSRPDVDLAASFLPATDGVSGDFYLVADGPHKGQRALVVGDVVGKGLEAARRAAFIRTVFATTAPFSDDPGQLLSWADTALCERAKDDRDFVTVGCVTYSPQDRILRWAYAGTPQCSGWTRRGTRWRTGAAAGNLRRACLHSRGAPAGSRHRRAALYRRGNRSESPRRPVRPNAARRNRPGAQRAGSHRSGRGSHNRGPAVCRYPPGRRPVRRRSAHPRRLTALPRDCRTDPRACFGAGHEPRIPVQASRRGDRPADRGTSSAAQRRRSVPLEMVPVGWSIAVVAWLLHVGALRSRRCRSCRQSCPAGSSFSRCSLSDSSAFNSVADNGSA